ncbi:hypothetical protein PCANC_04363 [Puccinia coronata f. sp. avenae]|uniref:Uncharacterized protein n=1 Tax=Puccinia coronata f. sp. avenae TaxID=200324 RepID=A0A2N5T925_9BASI|nr:hypothetical protein PCANC_04363 [Puccinia coronata f. sp. avenae]
MSSNSAQSTYFSFPSYESHFVSEMEESLPVITSLSQKALEPIVDFAAEAQPIGIIHQDWYREAEVELILYLRGTIHGSFPAKAASVYSEPSSSASSREKQKGEANHKLKSSILNGQLPSVTIGRLSPRYHPSDHSPSKIPLAGTQNPPCLPCREDEALPNPSEPGAGMHNVKASAWNPQLDTSTKTQANQIDSNSPSKLGSQFLSLFIERQASTL